MSNAIIKKVTTAYQKGVLSIRDSIVLGLSTVFVKSALSGQYGDGLKKEVTTRLGNWAIPIIRGWTITPSDREVVKAVSHSRGTLERQDKPQAIRHVFVSYMNQNERNRVMLTLEMNQGPNVYLSLPVKEWEEIWSVLLTDYLEKK